MKLSKNFKISLSLVTFIFVGIVIASLIKYTSAQSKTSENNKVISTNIIVRTKEDAKLTDQTKDILEAEVDITDAKLKIDSDAKLVANTKAADANVATDSIEAIDNTTAQIKAEVAIAIANNEVIINNNVFSNSKSNSITNQTDLKVTEGDNPEGLQYIDYINQKYNYSMSYPSILAKQEAIRSPFPYVGLNSGETFTSRDRLVSLQIWGETNIEGATSTIQECFDTDSQAYSPFYTKQGTNWYTIGYYDAYGDAVYIKKAIGPTIKVTSVFECPINQQEKFGRLIYNFSQTLDCENLN